MKRKKEKIYWVKGWLKKWDNLSHMSSIREVRVSNEDDLKNYLRMSDDCFRAGLSNFKLMAGHITQDI
jgi:hypothetical protein